MCGCPRCSVGKFGETYDYDTSGITNCGCIDGPGDIGRELRGVDMPTHFDMVWSGGTPAQWSSAAVGSADLWSGPNCGDLSYISTGQFFAQGVCIDTGLSQAIVWSDGSTSIVVFGTGTNPFTALGQSRGNAVTCHGAPNVVLFHGGTGTITAP